MRPDGSFKYAGVIGIHRNHAYIFVYIFQIYIKISEMEELIGLEDDIAEIDDDFQIVVSG